MGRHRGGPRLDAPDDKTRKGGDFLIVPTLFGHLVFFLENRYGH